MAPKSQKKKQQKIIEDRTFGLKNKNKSKAVQKFIKGVENTVKNQGKSAGQLEAERFQRQKQKKKQQQQQALLNSLYRDVGKLREQSDEQQDPKNVVCPYFKQGLCQKGKKCIYSHDLTLDRNQEIDLYVDQRTQLIMNQIGTKNLNDLTEQQLGKMINDKEKAYIKGAKSEIVCKFFLEAVEKGKYGWNWSCANGGDSCKYKHCLPPGYVLSKDGGGKIQVEQVNIQQKIDEQRNKLLSQNRGSPLVTYEVFLKWKEDKIKRKKQQQEKKKSDQIKKNKNKALLKTGKQLFNEDPNLFIDDQEAADNYDDREQIVQEQEEQGIKQQLREGDDGDDEEEQDQNENNQERQHEEGEGQQKKQEITKEQSS